MLYTRSVDAWRPPIEIIKCHARPRALRFPQWLVNSPNIEALQAAGVMSLLRPLLLDNVPSISQSAALALGRLANMNE